MLVMAQNYNNIEFVENKGQWNDRIKFKGEINAGALFIRSGGFTVLQHNQNDLKALQEMAHNSGVKGGGQPAAGRMVIRSHSYNVDFVGASSRMQIVPDKKVASHNNYFLGDDPSKWAADCKIFQAVTLKDVYDKIDIRYYTDNGMLKYDIIARPGADIRKIALKYEGADKISVRDKQLVIQTSVGELKESYPYTYQSDGKERKTVDCKYVVKDNVVRFDVRGYDPAATLVIDPFLIFSSFSGSTANNWGFTATYGPDGSFFGGGIVYGGPGTFPVTPGAFQTVYQGGIGDFPWDIGIMKLSADGSAKLYATYLGGSGNEQPHSLIVDNQGNLIVAGRSNSANFPLRGGSGTVIGGGGGFDIIVTKFNATGSDIIGSAKIGGSADDGVNIDPNRGGTKSLQRNYGDDGRSEVNIDGGGNIYVASCTQSNNFPTVGGFQPASGGAQDGVVLKLPPNLSILSFSSYLGGTGNDAAYVLSLSPSGDIYVAGGTESDNFGGGTTAGTVGATNHGGIDGFVAQIANNGSTLIRSTFIGTNGADQVYGIQFDRFGYPYITGQYTGAWAPINATYVNTGAKQFIGKLQPNLSSFVYLTFFGRADANPNISITAFLVDRCENVYVSGWGGSISANGNSYNSSGTTNMPLSSDALPYPVGGPDGRDFYFFVLKKDATQQLFGSYFGQNGGLTDHVDGGTSRFDRNGVIYQAVCANCAGGAFFYTTPGAVGPQNLSANDGGCNLGMIKLSLDLAGVGADVSSSIGGAPRDTAGCVPLEVVFSDQVRNATQYTWNFGDGTGDFGPYAADTGYTRTHTYTSVGTFRVRLIAINPSSCNVQDTSYMNIKVGDLEATLAGNVVKFGDCRQFNYRFENLSTTLPVRPFTDTSFIWRFGDGSAPVVAGLSPVTHTYPSPGVYNVSLVLNDSAYCNNPDSIQIVVRVAADVDALFETPALGCAPYTAAFTNTSVGGVTFQWDFGDGNTSTDINPTNVYSLPGTYNVIMVATDPNTCNVTDTARFTIVVYEKPTSDFSYTPVTPVENTPNIFTNLASSNANRFKWIFGDGDTLSTTSRSPVEHQYNATGTFDACLVAFNPAGCSDTLCRPVTTLVIPALDVPNAFTPNSNDINSRVLVRGFGIAKMRFIIYNRQGQKVFETNSRFQGWDGRVKGAIQPMDVYAYTLEVEFFDGTKTTKKGDITLIR
jgi:gliding motility-associated-like protein